MNEVLSAVRKLRQLASPPQVAIKIIDIVRDESKGANNLANVIRLDPAITSKVLRLSNSASYSRGREITSLDHAINLLGTKSISMVALGFSLETALPRGSENISPTHYELWSYSVATAVAGRGVARLIGKSGDEQAFLCGLLARVGQLILATSFADEYSSVLETASRKNRPTALEEKTALGTTHHDVAGELLRAWQMPHLICDVIQKWGNYEEIPESDTEVSRLARVTVVADAFSDLLLSDDKARSAERLYQVASDTLNIAKTQIDRLFVASEAELQDGLGVFLGESLELDCDAILSAANEQLIEVGLSVAKDLDSSIEDCDRLAQRENELRIAAMTDALTGLPNRHALKDEVTRLTTSACPYSVILIDVDRFKSINDQFGHAVGDEVLVQVASSLQDGIRDTDFLARFGGEEFIVLLPFCSLNEAGKVAERLRCKVREARMVAGDGGLLQVSVSAGVAASTQFEDRANHDGLVERADEALYVAKREGRDRVRVFSPMTSFDSSSNGQQSRTRQGNFTT